MKNIVWALLAGLLTLAWLGSSSSAQSGTDKRAAKLQAEFENKQRKLLVEAGHRHLELGLWCRDKGLVTQASNEFIRAVEVSEHRHPGAENVLRIMRSMGEVFWKKRRVKAHHALLEQYAKRSERATQKANKERYDLAKWAWSKQLDAGREEFLALLELNDAALEIDKRGRIVLPAGPLPQDLSQAIAAAAVTINERLWVRDKFLAKIPDVTAIHEVEGERLRVRSQVSLEQAQDVHDSCMALLPILEEDTGGRPSQRMNVFVFADSETYEAFLEVSQMSTYKSAGGLALSRSNMALVNSEGRSEDDTLGLALHELTHLFMYGTSRSRMPSWYSEGFAETYGGQGCFVWDGELLETGRVMAEHRIEGLKSGERYMPLSSLLISDALYTINKDKELSLTFYAQSWAFVRFMRHGAGERYRTRFELWEDICNGKALGAIYDKPTELGNVKPANELFEEMFGAELAELEAAFELFLAAL